MNKAKKLPKETRKKTKNKIKNSSKKDIIDLDNEIIIGLTPKKENNSASKRKKKKRKSIKSTKDKSNKKVKKEKNTNKKQKKQKTKRSIIVKWIILIILIILCIVLFMLSSVFNIKEIIVNNNNKITTEEIIALSELKKEENIFKTSNKTIRNKIKTNPYIEDVQIKKKLNGVIELNITERVATFTIKYADKYAYLNNQGYILEISQEPIDVPQLLGISTTEENIKPGNRLDIIDLEKLDTVIKIVATAKSLDIDKLITSIDVANDKDYILYLESELKTVHFGDESDKNDKIAWIAEIIEQKKGEEGEIFVNNLEKRAFFRKKI